MSVLIVNVLFVLSEDSYDVSVDSHYVLYVLSEDSSDVSVDSHYVLFVVVRRQ